MKNANSKGKGLLLLQCNRRGFLRHTSAQLVGFSAFEIYAQEVETPTIELGLSVSTNLTGWKDGKKWAENLGFGDRIPVLTYNEVSALFAGQDKAAKLEGFLDPSARFPVDLIGTSSISEFAEANNLIRLFDEQWKFSNSFGAGEFVDRLASISGATSSQLLRSAVTSIPQSSVNQIVSKLPNEFRVALSALTINTDGPNALKILSGAFVSATNTKFKVSDIVSSAGYLEIATALATRILPSNAGIFVTKAVPVLKFGMALAKAGPMIGMGPIGIGMAALSLIKGFGRSSGPDPVAAALGQVREQLNNIEEKLDAIAENQALIIGELVQIRKQLGEIKESNLEIDSKLKYVELFIYESELAKEENHITSNVASFWEKFHSNAYSKRDFTDILSHCARIAEKNTHPVLNGSAIKTLKDLKQQVLNRLYGLDKLLGASGNILSEFGTEIEPPHTSNLPNPIWWAFASHHFIAASTAAESLRNMTEIRDLRLKEGFASTLNTMIECGRSINRAVDSIASEKSFSVVFKNFADDCKGSKVGATNLPNIINSSIIEAMEREVGARNESGRAEKVKKYLPLRMPVGATRGIGINGLGVSLNNTDPKIYYYNNGWISLDLRKPYDPFELAVQNKYLKRNLDVGIAWRTCTNLIRPFSVGRSVQHRAAFDEFKFDVERKIEIKFNSRLARTIVSLIHGGLREHNWYEYDLKFEIYSYFRNRELETHCFVVSFRNTAIQTETMELRFLVSPGGELNYRRVFPKITELVKSELYSDFIGDVEVNIASNTQTTLKSPNNFILAKVATLGIICGFSQWRGQTSSLTTTSPALGDIEGFGISPNYFAKEAAKKLVRSKRAILREYSSQPDLKKLNSIKVGNIVITTWIGEQKRLLQNLLGGGHITAEEDKGLKPMLTEKSGLPIVNLILKDLEALRDKWSSRSRLLESSG